MTREELEKALGVVLDHPDLGDAARASLAALKSATSVSITHDPAHLVDRTQLIGTYGLRQRSLEKTGGKVRGLSGTLSLLKSLDCNGIDVIVAHLHPGYLTIFADPSGTIVGVLDLSWVRREGEEPSSSDT